MSECTHAATTWAKWPKMQGVRFGKQCDECLELVGRLVTLRRVPLSVDTANIHLAKIDFAAARKKGGRTGLGGRGNSRRKRYDKYMRSKHWREVRQIVLERDEHRCMEPGCSAPATEVGHIFYRHDIRDTRPEDCIATCRPCNLAERQRRIQRKALGD